MSGAIANLVFVGVFAMVGAIGLLILSRRVRAADQLRRRLGQLENRQTEGDALHAIATEREADLDRVTQAVANADDPVAASGAARALALSTVATALRTPADALRIGRRGRVPTLEGPGLPGPADLSLSHHL